MNMIKPRIQIVPFCIFCRHHTDSVFSFVYERIWSRPSEEILIQYPAHGRCLKIRLILRYIAFLFGAAVWISIAMMVQFGLLAETHSAALRVIMWSIALLAALFSGGVLFFKVHHRTIDMIYEYYVRNHETPEADKARRRTVH